MLYDIQMKVLSGLVGGLLLYAGRLAHRKRDTHELNHIILATKALNTHACRPGCPLASVPSEEFCTGRIAFGDHQPHRVVGGHG